MEVSGRVAITGALQSFKLLFEFVRVEKFGFLLGYVGKCLRGMDSLVWIGAPQARDEDLEDGRNRSNQSLQGGNGRRFDIPILVRYVSVM